MTPLKDRIIKTESIIQLPNQLKMYYIHITYEVQPGFSCADLPAEMVALILDQWDLDFRKLYFLVRLQLVML